MAVVVTREAAFTACSCRAFADQLSAASPFPNMDAALDAARGIWWQSVGVSGWLEAFAAHPQIGQSKPSQQQGPSNEAFEKLSHTEQAAARASTSEQVAQQLAALNQEYYQKFGHIFIICASGKTSDYMLQQLRARLQNTPYDELANAAREQMKITELRLQQLLPTQPTTSSAPAHSPAQRATVRTGQLAAHLAPAATSGSSSSPLRSPITTHVLDTALGAPAQGLALSLHKLSDHSTNIWDTLSSGVTNADGRVGDLLPPAPTIAPGRYQMRFATGAYLQACAAAHPGVFAAVPFYPEAVVDFVIAPDKAGDHYHIPLLLSPYGYSTYKGS